MVFIIAQGRSGGTLFWNMLRQLPEYHTYYEPLHPDLVQHVMNPAYKPGKDLRHYKIKNHWNEYHHLDDVFLTEQHVTHKASNEEIKAWLDFLIEEVPEGKIPVFKISRLGGRLEWLNSMFPDDQYVVTIRDSLDQWHSYAQAGFTRDYFQEWELVYKKYYPAFEQLNDLEFYMMMYELHTRELRNMLALYPWFLIDFENMTLNSYETALGVIAFLQSDRFKDTSEAIKPTEELIAKAEMMSKVVVERPPFLSS